MDYFSIKTDDNIIIQFNKNIITFSHLLNELFENDNNDDIPIIHISSLLFNKILSFLNLLSNHDYTIITPITFNSIFLIPDVFQTWVNDNINKVNYFNVYYQQLFNPNEICQLMNASNYLMIDSLSNLLHIYLLYNMESLKSLSSIFDYCDIKK